MNTDRANPLGRNTTVRSLLERKVRQHPDKPFVIFIDREGAEETLTYAEFDEQVNRLANWMLSEAITKGDRVLVHLPNCIGFVVAAHACSKIGAVFIPSIVFDSAQDLEYKLTFSQACLVITEPEYQSLFDACLAHCPSVRRVLMYRATQTKDGALSWDDALASASPQLAPVAMDSMDIAQMMFTSGTTARPKAVVHTHANLLYIGEICARAFAVQPHDRYMLVLPLFHVNAQCISWYPCLSAGASIVICERFSASQFSSLVREYHVTLCSLVAATLRMILAQPPNPLDSENVMWRCPFAIAITDAEWDAFERRFGTTLIDLYGLTETLAPCTIMPIWGEHRRGSVGWPNFGLEITIVDDQRRELSPGAVGEIAVKGEPGISLFKEYYNNPEATANALVDGWFYTGDHGRVDEDGYVWFIDRKKDVIQRAGENISAAEVERVLAEHPAIAECAVIGVPDKMRDEAVMAVLRLRTGMDVSEFEIIEYCRTKMAAFKVPSFVQIRHSEFDKTSIGKVRKAELRNEILQSWSPPTG